MTRIRGNAAFQIERSHRHQKAPVALTPRQVEILKMIAMGRTNREIAATLGLSIRTVEVHRFNLMRRLNVRNVAQLLRQSLRLGLLSRNFGGR